METQKMSHIAFVTNMNINGSIDGLLSLPKRSPVDPAIEFCP